MHTFARRLRREQTDAERVLWLHLRARQVNDAKFRRQQPIGRYIVDFCCFDRKVVIEIDGGQHSAQVEADLSRSAFLAQRGLRVLRFWNHEVLTSLDAVLQQITDEMNAFTPHPTLSHKGRGKTSSQ